MGLACDEWRVYLDAVAAQTKLKSLTKCESRTGVPADWRLMGRCRCRPSHREARIWAARARPSLWADKMQQSLNAPWMEGMRCCRRDGREREAGGSFLRWRKKETWASNEGQCGTKVLWVPASGLRLRFWDTELGRVRPDGGGTTERLWWLSQPWNRQ